MCLRKLGCHFPRWRCHIHRFVGKLHRGLFYLISHCIVERGLFLTGILLTQCARLRKALPNAFSKWLPSCKMAAKVCARSGPATATLPQAGGPSPPSPLPAATPERPPYTTATQKGRGKKNPNARLGTDSLAGVVMVSSRHSSSHRVLLVSHAWQKAIQGKTWGENTTVKPQGRFLYLTECAPNNSLERGWWVGEGRVDRAILSKSFLTEIEEP